MWAAWVSVSLATVLALVNFETLLFSQWWGGGAPGAVFVRTPAALHLDWEDDFEGLRVRDVHLVERDSWEESDWVTSGLGRREVGGVILKNRARLSSAWDSSGCVSIEGGISLGGSWISATVVTTWSVAAVAVSVEATGRCTVL